MKNVMAAVLALLLTLAAFPSWAADDAEVFEQDGVTYRYDYLSKSEVRLLQAAAEGVDIVRIPDTIKGYSVTRIGAYAFDGCKATEISIPKSVSVIEAFAFNDCTGIRVISIPATVYFIDGNPFTGCTSLVSIRLERDLGQDHPTLQVTSKGALYNKGNKMLLCYPCSRKDETFEVQEGTQAIGKNAFFGCAALKTITLPETVTEIGDGAFEGCANLTGIQLPESLLSLGQLAFAGCASMESADIPGLVSRIEMGTFFNCAALRDVSLPDNLTEIGDRAFYGCGALRELQLPDHVNSIGASAFGRCDALEKMNIPVTVTEIGGAAFSREAITLKLLVERYSYAEIYAKINDVNYDYGTSDEFLKMSK